MFLHHMSVTVNCNKGKLNSLGQSLCTRTDRSKNRKLARIIDSNIFIVHFLKDTGRIAHNQLCHVVAVGKSATADGAHGSGQTQC